MTLSANIVIIDYGLGNLFSVQKAMHYLGADAVIIDRPESLERAGGVILPGVGAFGDGMSRLEERGFIEPLKRYVDRGNPLLGICLGMQFLFSYSEEFGTHKGLNFINGKVIRLSQAATSDGCIYKIPHIGWNGLFKPVGVGGWDDTVLDGIKEHSQVYFVHSFVAVPDDESNILSFTEYGNSRVTAVVKKNNIYGCQFHPEKSRDAGLKVLQNFLSIVHGKGF